MTSSNHYPDERDLLDFADAVNAGQNPQPRTDEERTYLYVQNAMQGEGAAIPSTTKHSTWEDVMSTLALTPDAPVSNRTRKQQGLSSPPPRRAPRARRMQWTPLASVAAAVLVVIASFGVWFTSGNESTPPPVEPRQVAGLAPGEMQQIASPSPTYACDFSQDMPIFAAENGVPTEGTTLVWQKGGDLSMHCDEEPEGILLASNVETAGPVEGIPGLLQYSPVSETEASVSVFLNITNGLSYETGDWMVNPGFVQQSWGDFQNGKYLFVNDTEHKLVALDTDTMEALVIEDLFGEGAPDSFNLITAASSDNSTLAMAMLPQSGRESGETFALRGSELGTPGDILLLNTLTGETSWLTIPGDNVQLRSINLSPDGSKIAVELSQGNDRLLSDAIVSLISTADGTVLGQTEPFQPFMYASVWTDTGLAVQADMNLILLPFDGSDATTLYTLPESNTVLQGLQVTHDPNVVTVIATVCDGECSVAEADNSVVSVNVATGETQEFEGVNLAYVSWETQINLLLMTDPSVTLPDTTTYTAIDPVSGETVATFEDMPGTGYVENQRSLIGPKSIWSTSDFDLTVVAVSMKHMIELRSDGTEHSARLLPAPGRWADEGAGNTQATIFLAPSGSLLSAMSQNDEANGRFLLDLTDPGAEWSGSGSYDAANPGGGGYILFVQGVPNTPTLQMTANKPVKEVAQEDATVVADDTGNQSIPIVQMVDEQPMDGPVIWLTTTGDVMYDDGTEVTTIATGATQIQPQTTNVIKVMTDEPNKDSVSKDGREIDGYTTTYHNLVTGETLVDDGTFSSWLGGSNTFQSLTVLTIADAPRQWSIVNFETMESKSIAELTGGEYRSSESITVAVSNDFSTIAIGTSQYESEASALLMKPSGMPGEVAVIPADLSGVSWVSVPEGMPAVANISLSPDGSKIAFIASDNSQQGATMTVSVVDVATNEELTRTEQINSEMIIHFQWLPTGDAFVVLTRENIQRFATDGSESTVLFESENTIDQMPNMTGSDMIYLSVWSAAEGEFTPDPASSQLVILDPATGETITVDGNPWFMGGSYPVTITTNLAPIAVSQDGLTATLVHPITGEHILPDLVANVDDPTMRPDFEPEEGQGFYTLQTVQTAPNAAVSIVQLADGNMAAVSINGDTVESRMIQRPAGTEAQQVGLSTDGSFVTVGNSWSMEEGETMWMLDLSDDNSEWVQFDPNTRVYFTEVNED